MQYPEEKLISLLESAGVNFTASLPCEKIKNLLGKVGENFFHVPLTREEEGVGICAGAALAGKRPAMFVQSSGMGNMINALLSLTDFYKLPLAIFVSHRGVYKEKIEAQIPMGKRLAGILDGAGIRHAVVRDEDDFRLIGKKLSRVYNSGIIYAFLMSPAVWEACPDRMQDTTPLIPPLLRGELKRGVMHLGFESQRHASSPGLTRYEILKIIAPYLDSKIVVCNLGFPSKELFQIKHQSSNFYMLGSMGMATPIGLGIALATDKRVVVIDGDGSLLMNPGTLATAAFFAPKNLTILAIDNGSYGSTGDQPTLTSSCVDLEIVAKGFGIKNTFKVSTKKELTDSMKEKSARLKFIHALAVPGNKDVPDIPLHHLDIKKQVQDFIKKGSNRI